MAPRKSTKPDTIDPVKVCTLALKQVKCVADYNRIGTVNSPETLTSAWSLLTESEQQCITDILNNDAQPKPQDIADELIACDTAIELKRVKSEYGDLVKQAWKLLSQPERDRIKQLCSESQPEPQPQSEPIKQPKRALYVISQDLHQSTDELEAKLDEIDDPNEQATLINLWLQESAGLQGEMNERVNSYLWVIRQQKQRAEYRAAEGKRLRELAEQSEKLAKRLEGQLLNFMDSHNLSKLETKDFKVSPRHASQEPLLVDEDFPLDQVPDEFVVVSRVVNRKLVKEAIKGGQQGCVAKTI